MCGFWGEGGGYHGVLVAVRRGGLWWFGVGDLQQDVIRTGAESIFRL